MALDLVLLETARESAIAMPLGDNASSDAALQAAVVASKDEEDLVSGVTITAAVTTTVESLPPHQQFEATAPHLDSDRARSSEHSTASAESPPPLPSDELALRDRSRLFVVCGRGRKSDELRELFAACGEIKNLHFALDRSGKSRGFAFLQYKDPACAVDAIARFHHLRLADGHVLKVTVAKDKPVVAVGKLKRNQQQSSQETHDVSDASGADELPMPGKRQRSSPPTISVPLASRVAAPLQRVDRMNDVVHRLAAFDEHLGRLEPTGSAPAVAPESEVADAMDDMVAAIQTAGDHPRCIDALLTGYHLIAEHRSRQRASSSGGGCVATEETSTEQLTSSIHSFTLDAAPRRALPNQRLRPAAQPFTVSTAAQNPQQRVVRASLLRRRRQSSDDSDSSIEGGSDASMSRRKRSNVSRREPSHWLDVSEGCAGRLIHAQPPPPPPPLVSQALLPQTARAAAAMTLSAMAKKPCKRQSSDQSAEAPARLSKQRVTTPRSAVQQAAVVHSTAPSLTPHIGATACREPAVQRTKLFFIASRKFTRQELDAMFAVYGDLESVETVTTFGRIKTMAYVKYSNPQTAATVLESFHDDVRLDADLVTGEIMKLSLAEDELRSASSLAPPRRLDTSAFSPMLSSSFPPTASPPLAQAAAEPSTDKLWLLILYDRSLPSRVLSACVSQCAGMQFVDIKVFRSTGEPQGVAFVKFENTVQAADAARGLHGLELPVGSRKCLQAIVIEDPSLFSTLHSGSQPQQQAQERHQQHGGAWSPEPSHANGDDVDVSAVEARFAHLMRSSDASHSFSGGRPRMSIDETAAPAYREVLHPLWAAHTAASPQYAMLQYQQHQHPIFQHEQLYHQTPFDYYLQPQPPFYYAAHPSHDPARQPFAYAPTPWIPTPSPAYYQVAQSSPAFVGPPPMLHGAEYYPYHAQHVYAGHSATVSTPAAAATAGVATGDPLIKDESNGAGAGETSGSNIVETEALATTGGSSDSSDSAALTPAIYISSCRPLDLVAVVKALDDCIGVIAITKAGDGDDTVFVVDFADAAQASDAVEKLDGKVCSGRKLRVATVSPRGAKTRAAPSRRKRQRVDPRHRK